MRRGGGKKKTRLIPKKLPWEEKPSERPGKIGKRKGRSQHRERREKDRIKSLIASSKRFSYEGRRGEEKNSDINSLGFDGG